MNSAVSHPEFVSLVPFVLGNRVTVNLVTRFPPQSNISLDLDFETAASTKPDPAADEPLDWEKALRNSPYPNVEICILDAHNQEAAQLFIVEHQEPNISLTLHLRQPRPGEQYTVSASMIWDRTVIQQLDVPFTLENTTQGRD